jgi:alanyl-tRNA synthetase
MLSQTIRRNFLSFFKNQGHAVVSSSSVVPHDDPSLLFINAGMNQFKDVFLGKTTRDYTKAATAQKCIRVGGKHNDLDNVGHTTRHLTLFEMLGNFSFGDYFKKEAIAHAWHVSTQVFAFPEEKIWVTVFENDDEAFELWKQIVPEKRIIRMGEKDNFWAMGDTGPCGPCSELLFDRGDRYGNASSPKEDLSGERFLEFWNLVFMQYNKDTAGHLHTLPKQSIDTGAGLERIVSLKMGVDTVFATDVLRGLIAEVENTFSLRYDEKSPNAPAFHVIADHIRSLSFAIADGAQPSNIERGYVLRKILRRAVRYGRTLGLQEPFLAKILPRLIETMGPDYPELLSSQNRIAEILTLEEEAFLRTLKRGGSILQQVIDKASVSPLKQITGEDAFKLKDTYGFPLEEILLLAKDTGLQVNLDAYELLEEQAKERSRAAQAEVIQQSEKSLFHDFAATKGKSSFIGYNQTSASGTILAIVKEGQFTSSLQEGDEGIIVLDQTPFYAEKGGQVADIGTLTSTEGVFLVTDCQSPYPDIILHVGKLDKGMLQIGQKWDAQVDAPRRQKIASNHTATHLLHAALQHVLGPHIRQAGSLVEANRLRFDFNHHKAISKEELRKIEMWINNQIRHNFSVDSYELSYEEAQQRKEIKQFFGEKYGSKVRVIDLPCSKELCGGTHTTHIGTIGLVRVIKESSIAAGVRRIEAVTGVEAEEFIYEEETLLESCCEKLKTTTALLPSKLDAIIEENKKYAAEAKLLKRKELKNLAAQLINNAPKVHNVLFIAQTIALSAEELPLLAEDLSQSKEPFLLALATEQSDSCHLLIRISEELQKKGLLAGALIKEFAPYIEGKGGGKADSAQAGGKKPKGLIEVFAAAKQKLELLC